MLRAILILLLPLGAAACAAPRKPPQETGTVSPLARAALAEWEAWGSIVVVGWPEARPPDTAATPERFARLMSIGQLSPMVPASRVGYAACAPPLPPHRSGTPARRRRTGAAGAWSPGRWWRRRGSRT
jgi:hypothetical protein